MPRESVFLTFARFAAKTIDYSATAATANVANAKCNLWQKLSDIISFITSFSSLFSKMSPGITKSIKVDKETF